LGNLGVKGRKKTGCEGTEWVMWHKTGTSMDSCEHGKLNVNSSSIKGEEFVDKLSYYDLLKKDFAP
jgi:hypothetical protein